MIPALAIAAAVIAVLAIGWGVHLNRKLAQLTVAYDELQGSLVTQQVTTWTESQLAEKAVIRISWMKAGTAAYRVKLENIGTGPALELRFNLWSSNGYCPLEPEVMARLFPVTLASGEEHMLFALPSRWMTDPFLATVLWKDTAGAEFKDSAALLL